MNANLLKYFRQDKLPHIWCPGCGHGIIMGALVRAIDKVGLEQDKTVIVSGIGCSSRAPGYMNFDTLHTTHGRAIAFATGIKMAKPELNVIVVTGDGDGAAIGGNHLIHACRRNIGLTVIMFNNNIYGMTSGQYSPLTPVGKKATTAPYGNIDPEFDICNVVKGAGATFIARGTAYHVKQLIDIIARGLTHDGFAFIETLTQCPINYGRRNKFADPVEMLMWQKEVTVSKEVYDKLSEEEKAGKIVTGILYHDDTKIEYTKAYEKVIELARKGGQK
ncbi:2-oxoacid:ferredoxin oxidoreductase subunit beta [Anoxybacter fermentans]|uniref:2-oxoacid:ferredoxin oxidoreductase subunit beta n=1 Tax=Anoxybacter fermentans TaxID=1323375 RepID=A0A3Q9HRB9_9FIRM|nr:thiamine pyrophosphate-dependent enzyme [Anoxybacter fermentans]AZR72816.1 2-oxoacid:ferredoxin oxidoreductase subunit beta [Anoxybacter fermentans]